MRTLFEVRVLEDDLGTVRVELVGPDGTVTAREKRFGRFDGAARTAWIGQTLASATFGAVAAGAL